MCFLALRLAEKMKKIIIFEIRWTNREVMIEGGDAAIIRARGLDEQKIERQLARFRDGFPYLDVVRPASVGDGITSLGEDRLSGLSMRYESACDSCRVVKFVPASGAATRMFKELFGYLASGTPNAVTDKVLSSLNKFAFYEALNKTLPSNPDDTVIIRNIVEDSGLGYGKEPKALILFHRYPDEVRTALEEHLVEGAGYASCGGKATVHFTVSPEHISGFEALLQKVLPKYSERFGIEYEVGMSVQKSSTDTIAVNPDNTPFRNPDGTLLFRPAGHGALIENLNELDADIIFIKNIDNVTTDSRRGDTIRYKKALAGLLLETRDKVFSFMRRFDSGLPGDAELKEASDFVREVLCVGLPEGFGEFSSVEKASLLRKILDRPVRVCGMVRNEGEPGGGPFFVRGEDGMVSLQVVESSQISPERQSLMMQATHFNPVDIVCSVRDHKGVKYDLTRYVDPSTGFISEKSKDGKPLKAQELPGLWNGAMARWNTVFAEVPITTFTPVKVVTDLLRREHQG